jgi:hypothetical protein
MTWARKVKPVRYVLEIMPPGARAAWPSPESQGPLLRVEATTPFQPFHAWNELLLRDFTSREEQQSDLSRLVLRVVKVRRCIAKSDGRIDDHVILFTEELGRRADARQGGVSPETN